MCPASLGWVECRRQTLLARVDILSAGPCQQPRWPCSVDLSQTGERLSRPVSQTARRQVNRIPPNSISNNILIDDIATPVSATPACPASGCGKQRSSASFSRLWLESGRDKLGRRLVSNAQSANRPHVRVSSDFISGPEVRGQAPYWARLREWSAAATSTAMALPSP